MLVTLAMLRSPCQIAKLAVGSLAALRVSYIQNETKCPIVCNILCVKWELQIVTLGAIVRVARDTHESRLGRL